MMLVILIFSLKILWARRFRKDKKHGTREQPKFWVELWDKTRSYVSETNQPMGLPLQILMPPLMYAEMPACATWPKDDRKGER